jgi:hypothetical protein
MLIFIKDTRQYLGFWILQFCIYEYMIMCKDSIKFWSRTIGSLKHYYQRAF